MNVEVNIVRFSINLEFQEKSGTVVKLPITYQAAVLHLIKIGLEHVDKQLFDELYNRNFPKLFSLSMFFPDATFSANSITLGSKSNAKLNFMTDDLRLGLSFYNAFVYLTNCKSLQYNSNITVKFFALHKLKEPFITTSAIIVKTLSPLVVRKDGLFLSGINGSDLVMYNETLRSNMCARFEKYYGSTICDKLKLLKYTPVSVKKTVVKSFNIYVEATNGVFLLEGDPVILNLVIKNGLGVRTGSFCGALDYLGGAY